MHRSCWPGSLRSRWHGSARCLPKPWATVTPSACRGPESPGLSQCTFDAYAQYIATTSGRDLTCVANPYFVGKSDDPYAYENRGRPFPPTYNLAPQAIIRDRATRPPHAQIDARANASNAKAKMQPRSRPSLPKEVSMRMSALVLLAAGTLLSAQPTLAQTYAGSPVCLHVYGPVSYDDCSYTTLASCNASASGRPASA